MYHSQSHFNFSTIITTLFCFLSSFRASARPLAAENRSQSDSPFGTLEIDENAENVGVGRRSSSVDVTTAYLWDVTQIETTSTTVVNFAVNNKVSRIYLAVDPTVSNSIYQRFLTDCHAKSIAVDALMGDPLWGLTAYRGDLNTYLTWLSTFQSAAGKTTAKKFDGLHIDIEPYTLDQWSTNQTDVVRQWQSNTMLAVNKAKALGIPITASLPFWLNTVATDDKNVTLDAWMFQNINTAAIMAYRNTAAAMLDVASTAMAAAASAGKTAFIAAETNESSEGSYISFYGLGKAYFNKQIATVRSTGKTTAGYAGIAIHDYTGFTALT